MSDNQPIESLRMRCSVFPEPANHDELISALAAAKTGNDPESARALISEMLRQLQAGSQSITPYVENWIIHAFAKIIEDGYSADQAFGLKARHGMHARPNTQDRDIISTAIVILAMRAGNTWEFAIGDAANRLFDDRTGDAAVKAAYSKYRDSICHLSNEDLADLIPH